MQAKHKRERIFAGLTVLFIVVIATVAVASPGAGAVSQSFYALNNNAQPGMLMSVSSNPKAVEPANPQNAKSLVGVVAPASDAAWDQQSGQISIEVNGVASALVSTLNGDISVGDRISPSSISGIGSRLVGSGWILGTAQASFNAGTSGAVKSTVKDANGKTQKVYITTIPIVVKITYFTAPANEVTWAPQVVQTVANSIAGHQVSVLALVLSSLVLLVGIFIAGVVINSAVRGGMLAISRQPLTKAIITRQILRSFGMALIVLAVMLTGAILLLRIL